MAQKFEPAAPDGLPPVPACATPKLPPAPPIPAAAELPVMTSATISVNSVYADQNRTDTGFAN
jgi:hypothetical protein